MNDECSEVIKKIIEFKNKFPFNCTNNSYKSRYCNQDNFDIIVVGSECKQDIRNAFTIDSNDFASVSSLPIIKCGKYDLKIVCIKDEIYTFVGFDNVYKPVNLIKEIHLLLTLGMLIICMMIEFFLVHVRLLIGYMC